MAGAGRRDQVRRLCVYYRGREAYFGNPKVEWIVCKECQRELERGKLKFPPLSAKSEARNDADYLKG